jgi:Bacteriophage tail tube protein
MPRIDEAYRNFSLRSVTRSAMFLGISDITLPSLASKAIEMAGSGIAGSYEAIIQGHYTTLSATVNLHTPSVEMAYLMGPNQQLEARGEIQGSDSVTGADIFSKAVFAMYGNPKTKNLGKLVAADKGDASVEYALKQLIVSLDDVEVFAWNGPNYMCRINGFDVLVSSRDLLGFV